MKLQILQGDVFEQLPKIPSESIDLVLTSPPYWGSDSFKNSMEVNTSMEKRSKTGQFIKGIHYNRATEFKKGQHWRPRKAHWDRDWLYEEYVVKQRSASEIAKQEGCMENNILFWLRKHGIKKRTVSEVRKIKHWGAEGADNPMFNRRGELHPNWKGGLTPERQAFYSSREWKRSCRIVWKRDNAECQRCLIHRDEGVPMHIHHIVSFVNRELRAVPENLVLLCDVCHHWVHSNANKEKIFLRGEENQIDDITRRRI